MLAKPIFIVAITQVDNHTLKIKWNDDSEKSYRLCDLQRLCPCANCVDESSGVRKVLHADVSDNVTAIKIQNVGRYGIKIQFSSGCSTGIYSYTMLHSFFA